MAKKPSFDPDPETFSPATPPAGEDPESRGRQTAAPECPYHHVACKSRNSGPFFTRYYCPIEGCTFVVKQPRPALRNQRHPPEDFSAR